MQKNLYLVIMVIVVQELFPLDAGNRWRLVAVVLAAETLSF